LILAAADCALGKAEPPPELKMAWDADAFGIPPYKGSRAEQPAGLLDKMRKCMNVYNAVQEEKRIAKGADAKAMQAFYTSDAGKTCRAIKKLRENG